MIYSEHSSDAKCDSSVFVDACMHTPQLSDMLHYYRSFSFCLRNKPQHCIRINSFTFLISDMPAESPYNMQHVPNYEIITCRAHLYKENIECEYRVVGSCSTCQEGVGCGVCECFGH